MDTSHLWLLLLALVPVAHSVYRWGRHREEEKHWGRKKPLMAALTVGCAAALGASLALTLLGGDSTAAMGLGSLGLLAAIWLDFLVGRVCGE